MIFAQYICKQTFACSPLSRVKLGFAHRIHIQGADKHVRAAYVVCFRTENQRSSDRRVERVLLYLCFNMG